MWTSLLCDILFVYIFRFLYDPRPRKNSMDK